MPFHIGHLVGSYTKNVWGWFFCLWGFIPFQGRLDLQGFSSFETINIWFIGLVNPNMGNFVKLIFRILYKGKLVRPWPPIKLVRPLPPLKLVRPWPPLKTSLRQINSLFPFWASRFQVTPFFDYRAHRRIIIIKRGKRGKRGIFEYVK